MDHPRSQRHRLSFISSIQMARKPPIMSQEKFIQVSQLSVLQIAFGLAFERTSRCHSTFCLKGYRCYSVLLLDRKIPKVHLPSISVILLRIQNYSLFCFKLIVANDSNRCLAPRLTDLNPASLYFPADCRQPKELPYALTLLM